MEVLFSVFLVCPIALLCILAMLVAWKDVTVIRAACIIAILAGSTAIATLVAGAVGGTDDPEVYGAYTSFGLILRKTIAGLAGGLAAGLSLQLLRTVPALVATKTAKPTFVIVSAMLWTFMGFMGGYAWVQNLSFGITPMNRFITGFTVAQILMFANSNTCLQSDNS
jgi:hypothetical protein